MRIRHLRLADFRNVTFAEADLDHPRVFLLGENGQGKTNLLEAVGLLPALRSFRTQETAVLIRHGATAAQVGCSLAHEEEGEVSLALTLTPRQKTVAVDGETIRQFSSYLGRFPAVPFCADDLELLRGAPARRRRWLDLVLAANDTAYLDALRRYHAALAGRNQLLRQHSPDAAQLSAFEKVLAPCAAVVLTRRRAVLAELAAELAEACAGIGLPENAAGLDYAPNTDPESAAAWLELYERHRPADLLLRATQRGPHRDDFHFRFAGHPAREMASEGQQRGLVLGLGLAWLARLRRQSPVAPVVLADDILGELDPARKAGFWQALGMDSQVLATGTTPPPGAGNWHVIRVKNGTYVPC